MYFKRTFCSIGFMGFLLNSSFASTNAPNAPTELLGFHPLISLISGVASMDVNRSQTFQGTDGDLFTYNSNDQSPSAGFIGAFLGVEHPLPRNGLFLQTGIEYIDFNSVSVRGANLIGIEPATSTLYSYHYRFQTQQVLAVIKLFTTYTPSITHHHPIYPYVTAGLGAAFNRSSQFAVSTQETGSINLAPTFRNNTNTAFSYIVGVGVETPINQKFRIGLGYRFSGFGNATLGSGEIALNNYRFPMSFTPSVANPYANQFVAQISYHP